MPKITFKISGSTKWLAGVVEDHAGHVTPFGFNAGKATIDVAGGGLASFSLYARGNAGTPVTAEVFKGEKSLAIKRNYKIDPDGSLARSIPFNPDE